MKKLIACLLFLAMALACFCGAAEPLSLIDLPKGLRLIDEGAFSGTAAFERVELPEGAERIASRAFAQSGVREVYIPASVTDIAEDAFEGCENLKVFTPKNSYAHEWLAFSDLDYELIETETAAVYAAAGVALREEADEAGALLRYAGASVTAGEDCTLVMRVLSEEEAVLHALSVPVAAPVQEVYLEAALDAALPAYYILEAVLVDEAGEALCEPCRNLRYTQAYAEFEQRTMADYPQEQVIDFGDSGFAVMAEGVMPLDVPAKEDGGSYTFAADAVLQKGDIIRLDVSGAPVIIKVGALRENGDGTVTVTADEDIYLEEMYDAVRISADMEAVPLVRAKSGDSSLISFEHTSQFGPLDVTAELAVDIHIDFKYDKNILKDFEMNITLDTEGALEVLLGAGVDTVREELLTGEPGPAFEIYNGVVIIPGIHAPAFFNVSLPLQVVAETGGSASVGFEACHQYTLSGKNGYSHQKTGESSNAHVELKGEFEMKFGLEASLTVSLLGVVNTKIGAFFGPKLTGREYGPDYGGSTKGESIHGCSDCLDLDLYLAADIRGTAAYKISRLISGTLLDAKLAAYENKLGDAYFSVFNDADSLYGGRPSFGMGDCKNFKYRVIATAIDRYGAPADGTPIAIENTSGSVQPEPGVSPYKLYLYNNLYSAEADFGGGVTAQHFFEVKDAPVDVNLYEPAFSVAGCVTDYTTGLPIAGAEVVVTMPSGEEVHLVADENGCYALDMLPPGEYRFDFSADGYVSEEGVRRTLQPDTENRVDAALMPEGAEGSERPYILSQAWLRDENIEMGGRTYADAVVFEMGYTGFTSTRNKAEAAYNFKGKYSSMSFDVGYFEGKEKNAKLTVIADGATLYKQMEIAYDAAPQRITVPLAGVHQLIIRFENSGSDKSRYAIGNIALAAPGGTGAKARISDSGFDAYITELHMADVKKDSFYMGGYNYLGGVVMTPGYNGTSNYDAYATFELDSGCTGLSFDMARMPGDTAETYLREAKLTIEVNGTVLSGYSEREVAWNDLPLEVNIPLSGASTVKVKLYSKGAGMLYWGMGNIQIR